MKSIGEQAKAYREAKAWTLTRMAQEVTRHAGTTVSRQVLTQLEEKGHRRPQYLSALAKTMGTTVEVLDAGRYVVPTEATADTNLTADRHQNKSSTTERDFFVIPQHEAGGSMGKGLILQGEQPGIIRSMTVTQEWATKNLKSHTGLQNLCLVTGFGDSMRPMFNPGDPLILDQGVTSCEVDAVYYFRVDDQGFIKRLQRIPGEGIRVISANKEYETWTIKRDADFEVFGRVMKAWRSEDL